MAIAPLARSPHISYVIARLERAVRKEIGRLVGPRGLSVAQYTTLSILRSRSGLSNAQLARRLWVTPQSMNEVISALERAGLIERVPDAANRRILRTALTAARQGDARRLRRGHPGDGGADARRRDARGLHEQIVEALEDCVRRIGEQRTDAV